MYNALHAHVDLRTHSISITKERLAKISNDDKPNNVFEMKDADEISVGFIPPLCTHSHVLILSVRSLNSCATFLNFPLSKDGATKGRETSGCSQA